MVAGRACPLGGPGQPEIIGALLTVREREPAPLGHFPERLHLLQSLWPGCWSQGSVHRPGSPSCPDFRGRPCVPSDHPSSLSSKTPTHRPPRLPGPDSAAPVPGLCLVHGRVLTLAGIGSQRGGLEGGRGRAGTGPPGAPGLGTAEAETGAGAGVGLCVPWVL